ncbi:hypothetical protein [Fluviicola taffensis]|uniref:hypothetical protein n=1 Tax=Fluviicola taffensis TaxID=191579 RepID=UPI0011D1D44A|nr:hypothetical protein [Fluviicola taffensis]
MIHKLLLILLLGIPFNEVYSQQSIIEAENLNTLGLLGKVKTVQEISYNAKKGTTGITKSTKGWQYEFENDSESFFDTLGNLILENKVEASKKEAVYSIKYDSLNRIICVNRFLFTHHFNYDSLNRIASSQKENRPVGNNSKSDSKTEATTNYIYYYDSLNLLIKTESFGDLSGVSIETFQYDTLKNLILSEFTKGDYTETHQYKYNENQQLIKEEWKDNKEGIAEVTTFNYKNKAKILERWIDYEDGKPDGSIDDTFENGNIVKTVEVDSDGVIAVLELCTYEFDKTGNWIRKTINSNEKYYIVERFIEYY